MTTPISVLIRPWATVESESLRHLLRAPCDVLAVEKDEPGTSALVLALPRSLPSAAEISDLVAGTALPIVMVVDVVEPWTIALSRSLGRPTLTCWRSPPHEIVRVIRTVATAPADLRRPPVDALLNLSKRERDVMSLLAMGHQDAAIATCLGISVHTVRSHVQHALLKLDVSHRNAAATLVRASPLMNRGLATGSPSHPRQIAGTR